MADATRSLKIVVEEERKGDGYNQAGKDTEQYADKVSAADAKTKQWGETQKTLQAEIDKSKTKIRDLHQEVGKTGDVSLFGDIRREESKLKGFESTLKALAPDVGKTFSSTIGDSLKGIDFKGAVVPGLIGAAVFASPGIAAAIAGAVTAGVGTIGVAGGLFAASHDQRVRAAASDLGDYISSSFFSSGSSFVDPIVASVDILKKDFAGLDLGHTFEVAAPLLTKFAEGIGGLADEFMPGFNKALQDAGPTVQVLANDLPKVGKAIGDMVAKLADSKGATEGLDSLLADTVGVIDVLGTSIAWLGDRYSDYNSFLEGSFKGLAKFENLLGDKASAQDAQDMADAYGAVGRQAYHAAGALVALDTADVNSLIGYRESEAAARALDAAMKDMNDELDKWINKSLAAGDASIAVAQDFSDLGKAGAKGWDLSTQAGREHQKLVNQSIADLERQREAAIAAGDGSKASIDAANKSYQEQLDHLKKIAGDLGATKAQVDALAGKYDIDVYYHNHGEGTIGAGAEIKYAVSKRASGGPVMAGNPYWVGERGPELYVPSQNGRIIPNGVGTGGGTTQPAAVDVRVSLDPALTGRSGDIAAALMQLLRFEVRTGASGDANLAFGGKTTQALAAS